MIHTVWLVVPFIFHNHKEEDVIFYSFLEGTRNEISTIVELIKS